MVFSLTGRLVSDAYLFGFTQHDKAATDSLLSVSTTSFTATAGNA